ncbi:MAG: GNAT family N-acetyltransferase [Muribaculum sp.]|nr:GNAT family N-acetyltransferase [Muribaculum sp.]
MDTKRQEAINIWRHCFDDSREYTDMYFTQVYRDDDCLTLDREGKTVASLLLQPYAMRFHSMSHAPVGYICGVGTLPQWRNRGCMTELMHTALRESMKRGYMFDAVIPADETLELYYRGFGFSPAFRVDRQRYTARHTFRPEGEFTVMTDFDSDRAYSFFDMIMSTRMGGIQHSRHQYDCILMDNSVDAGSQVGVCDAYTGEVRGMAFVVPRDGTAVVTDILSTDTDASEAVMNEVRRQYPDMPIEVLAMPGSGYFCHGYRGMARIIDAEAVLKVISSSHPALKRTIRLHDNIIAENNDTFVIGEGSVRRVSSAHRQPDLDTSVEVFTSIVFGNDVTASIFDFPSIQPFISLMLD